MEVRPQFYACVQQAAYDCSINLSNQARCYRSATSTETTVWGQNSINCRSNVYKVMAAEAAPADYQRGVDEDGDPLEVDQPRSGDQNVVVDITARSKRRKKKKVSAGDDREGGDKDKASKADTVPAPKIEVRKGTATVLKGPSENKACYAQPVRVHDGLAEDFVSSAARLVRSTGDFRTCDLSALISQLAAGVAYWSLAVSFTMSDLAGGNDLKLHGLSAMVGPLGASQNTIWVPAHANDMSSPHVLSAIVAAASAVGSTVVSDRVVLNAENQPILEQPSDADLARGCLEALRIIGSNYVHNNASGVFAYAMAKGVTRVLTVVGMTDEGAYMRSVLRATAFTPSYGGVNTLLRSWTALPDPLTESKDSWVALADSMALAVAASVALSDPCVHGENGKLPTIFGSPQVERGTPGVHQDGGQFDGMSILSQILSCCSEFSQNYVSVLAQVFKLGGDAQTTTSQDGVAAGHLQASFSEGRGVGVDRHLRHKTVAPWYWIEPTGVIDEQLDTTAQAAGFGVLCTRSTPGSIPLFEGVELEAEGGGMSVVRVGWRTARTCGAVLHFGGHPQDGLANMVLSGADPEQFANLGRGNGQSCARRMGAQSDLAGYLWARGENRFCAPGEMVYTGKGLRFKLVHMTHGQGWDTFNCVPTHMVNSDELYGMVRVRVSPLVCGVNNVRAVGSFDSRVARTYTTALSNLSFMRHSALKVIRAGALAPIVFSDPGAPSVKGPAVQLDMRREDLTEDTVTRVAHEKAQVSGDGIGRKTAALTARAAEVGVVRVHEASRGPTADGDGVLDGAVVGTDVSGVIVPSSLTPVGGPGNGNQVPAPGGLDTSPGAGAA